MKEHSVDEIIKIAALNSLPSLEEDLTDPLLAGEYRLSIIRPPKLSVPILSSFTVENLMYVQCVSLNGTAGKNHYTRRTGCPSFMLTYTNSGEGQLFYQGASYVLRKGDFFLIDCRKEHVYRCGDSNHWSYDLLHMNGGAMEALFSLFDEKRQYVFSSENDRDLLNLLTKIYTASMTSSLAAELEVHRLLTTLWGFLINLLPEYQSAFLPEHIRSVCRLIENRYRENISLARMADEAKISKYALCREFKKYIGTTPGDYLTKTRLRAARYLLVSTDLPIDEIAKETGFDYPNYFYRVFKKWEGITPRQCRIGKNPF